MRSALVYGLVFGIAPIHVGYAAVMAVPMIERSNVWWLFHLAAGAYLWGLVMNCMELPTGDKAVRLRTLLLRWYLLPILAFTLFHAAAVLVTACGREWQTLAETAVPSDVSRDVNPDGIPPPPGGPPRDIGPFLSAALDLVARAAKAMFVFVYRLWLGTPTWLFLAASFVAWIVTPNRKTR